jgi:hypothetical protein
MKEEGKIKHKFFPRISIERKEDYYSDKGLGKNCELPWIKY